MPVLDYPLEELKTYQGTNPKPTDFDQYWDSSVAAMRQLGTQHTITPFRQYDFKNVECFTITFSGMGGSKTVAKYLRPKGAKNCPVVLEFHGYGHYSAEWSSKLQWIQQGMCVASMDCRGQGGNSDDHRIFKGNTLRGHIIRGLDHEDPKDLYYHGVFLDTAQLARIVASFDEVDSNRIVATGNSQGGALTLACAALEPSIRKIVPVFPFLSDFQRVWDMDQADNAYAELREYFRRHDPTHQYRAKTFEKLGYIDCHHLAPRIKANTLMAITQMDNICPPSTQFACYNKLTSQKRYVLYPDYGHEYLPGFSDEALSFISDI